MASHELTVTSIESIQKFEEKLKNSERVVCHFWATWSQPCLQLQPVMKELSNKVSSDVQFIQVEAENLPELSIKNNIIAVPTFILYKEGVEYDRVNGAHAAELTKKVQKLSDIPPMPEQLESVSKEQVEERCKALIDSASVILFMKGSSEQPRCKFSRRTIEILNDNNIDFLSFDILEDNEIREGLKEYSNWPTYPQLYHNSELLGGVDIIEAMNKSGELSELPKKEKLEDKLQKLITSNRVMLFMKGSPSTPKCQFSRAVIDIMNEEGVEFGSFDILEDNSVREGLKEYSNWPTYPQLYVDNELIGGIDIIKSLKEQGKLQETLTP